MKTVLAPDLLSELGRTLANAAGRFPDTRPNGAPKQPIHVVYGGAHLFRTDTAQKLGAIAQRSLADYAPDAASLANAIGLRGDLAEAVYGRVAQRLEHQPVEDYRLDFEDGYGYRPDAEEDGHAESAACEVARGMETGQLPANIGIRIKPLNAASHTRSIRTLDIFLGTLAQKTAGKLPPGFVVTLPKIASPVQIEVLVSVFDKLEAALGLGSGALKMELMIETPQSILNERGECALPGFIAAAGGRCRGLHFGPYDYTASLGITAAHQHLRHPACNFARAMMQVAAAGTEVWLADGPTTVLPIPSHRAAPGGPPLSAIQQEQNRASVHRAWKLHFEDVQQSLANGFYQGWDLHPAQLVTRYAAVYAFFLSGLEAASSRLRNFVEAAAQATRIGSIFDDAATGQGLLNYFLRAIHAGALTEEEVREKIGLRMDELRRGSFLEIVKSRREEHPPR
jgi:citrate lyase beta subunit